MWLVALLVVIWSLPCVAGESFLDRSKVREAVPYGTTIEPPSPEKKTTAPTTPDHDAGRPSSTTSGHSAPGSIKDDHGRDRDRRQPTRDAVAMPLIAGPGTIITAMTMTARASSVGSPWMVLVAVAVVAVVVWLVLVLSGVLHQRFGMRGEAVVVRFMGLVLVDIGAQLVLAGIADFFGATGARAAG